LSLRCNFNSTVIVHFVVPGTCTFKELVTVVVKLQHNLSTLWTARPKYRKSRGTSKIDAKAAGTSDIENVKGKPEHNHVPIPQLNTQISLRQAIKEVKLVHVRILLLFL